MLRGNNGEPIFFTDENRKFFYSLLEEGVQRFHHKIHAFCLMSNHVHLAIEVDNTSLSKIIQNISFRYARRVNKFSKRIGHLFQGRFKAILIDAETYLISLIRYIHLNPVRAHLTTKADEYFWSSHRAYLGYEHYPWLTINDILSRFGNEQSIASSRYYHFIENTKDDDKTTRFQTGNQKGLAILADEQFVNKLPFSKPENNYSKLNLNHLIEAVCLHYGIKESDLHSRRKTHVLATIRATIAWLAQESKICTITAVAAYFNRNISSLTRTINKLSRDGRELEELYKQIKDI
jgi:REP element-mobilizing transposase RayT